MALYDFLMMHEMREQPKGAPDNVDDAHKHRLELTAKMEENWHKLLLDHGADERTWAKRTTAELEAMQTEISRWIQECERVKAHLPPEGRETIVDDWIRGLTRKNDKIQEVIIDKKRGVT